jgi:hypothetical protein
MNRVPTAESLIADVSTLTALFDRRRTHHKWFPAFVDLEARGGPNALVCGNWRMDHRVTKDREEAMLKAPEFALDPAAEEWCGQRHRFFEQAIRRPTFPGPWGACSAYLEPYNRANSIDLRSVPGHEQLVHVGSLNRLVLRLLSGAQYTGEFRVRFFDLTKTTLPPRLPVLGVDPGVVRSKFDSIAQTLIQAGPEKVKLLARLLCDTLGDFQPPWWACFAAEAATTIAAKDGASLCQALGMGHVEANEWLIIWRYDLNVLERLYPGVPLFRPTVIEANDNPCHYPAPPGYRYGITMPLGRLAGGALREVLHPPLHGAAAELACTGDLVRVTASPLSDYNELPRLRRDHRSRLLTTLGGSDTKSWIDRHHGLA